MDGNVDNEVLISLVQTKPVLWDKTLPIYKDRNATKNAWKDVCCEINKNFEDMEDKEKNEFGKAVIRRWTNLRDAFSKSTKKQQHFKKSGSAAPNVKKYVYNDQMQSLKKVYELRETVDSLGNTPNSEDGLADNNELQPASDVNEGVVRHNQATNKEKMAERFGNRKRRNPDEIELKMLKALEPEKPNSHMSFFEGVIPHLKKYDDSEVLAALQLLKTNCYVEKIIVKIMYDIVPYDLKSIVCANKIYDKITYDIFPYDRNRCVCAYPTGGSNSMSE
ncbi:uncharacterized protein [Onthophagus taurus]|uniref:uncharacterized protein n=1 Tax=Onthophagus taurus TaxID=166361 RepID=UPI0039BE618D